MNREPKLPPADIPADADERAFAVLDNYWEVLLRGDARELQQHRVGASAHDNLREYLRVLDSIHDAYEMLEQDTVTFVHADTDSAAPPDPAKPPREFLPAGTMLGECRIERLLGAGGMGEVYLAHHAVLDRKVAVKVLPAHLHETPQAESRFLKEVQTLARMDHHPNIVMAMHASQQEGRLYLVMEYVPGINLRKLVGDSGPLPVAQACDYIRQAATGLAYAHEHKIVHRDIKPSNLLLTPSGTIKILDLGLARLAASESSRTDASMTHPGSLLGTPDYLAPEQARDASRADARSDLYSLGCTFYHLLTGRPPFGDRAQVEKLMAHAEQPPEPIQQLRPDVPAAVAVVVEKLMAKRPEDRYQTAQTLIETLTVNAEPTVGTPADAAAGSSRANNAERRQTMTKAFLTTAAIGLVALTISAIYFSRNPRHMKTGSGPSSAAEHAGSESSERGTASEESAGRVEIRSMEIRHFRSEPEGDIEVGTLGTVPTIVRFDDAIRLHAEFSRPAYCYLIECNPIGECTLQYPKDQTARPTPIDVLDFPVNPTQVFALNDGVGLEAFILAVSAAPLPPFAEWRLGVKDLPWSCVSAEVMWRFDGRQFEPLGVERGTERSRRGLPKPFADLCNLLKERGEFDAIHAIAFPVK